MIDKNLIKIDSETEFFKGLIELQYGLDVKRKLRDISNKVDWAKGWPNNKKSFWNAEAFMWQRKVDQKIRKKIKNELDFLKNGKNLDLGCGSYSYLKSVGFDLSEKMLNFNENCIEKVVGDLERKLPFESHCFDSVTAIFVLNYINNYSQLLQEVRRVLNKGGVFMMVLFAKEINSWQKQKEVNSFSWEKWEQILIENDFNIVFYEKEKLFFFKGSNI